MKKIVVTLLFICFSQNIFAQSAQVVVNPENKAQQLEGWGVSLCWWAHMCGKMSDEQIDVLVDWLTSPEGLNYNLFRYNIGGGDDPQNRNCELHHMAKGKGLRAEMPGFKLYPESAYDWSADSSQVKIMLKIREKRPEAIFEAFSNSAPWWMTISGCCAGNKDAGTDNLHPKYYDAFAQYLVDVCQHMKLQYGIEFRSLEPFNESLSNYWGQSGSQEGCHFDVATQVKVIDILHKKLQKSGLKTVISASDETSTAHALTAFDGYGKALKQIGQWNVHTYGATNQERQELYNRVKAANLPLWMSESGSGGNGIAGNINMLQRLFDDMRYLQPIGWCDWQYIEEKGDQWNLVLGNYKEQSFKRVKNYYVRQQVTRFIKSGYSFLQVDNDQTLAAISPDDKTLVIVCLNNTEEFAKMKYQIPVAVRDMVRIYTTSVSEDLCPSLGVVVDNEIEVSLPPHAVKTMVLKTDNCQRVNESTGQRVVAEL